MYASAGWTNTPSSLPNQIKSLIKEKIYNVKPYICNPSFINYDIGGYMNGKMSLKGFEYDGIRLKFKEAYQIEYVIENGHYYADDISLNIYCSGCNISELIHDIQVCLTIEWEMYVECDEKELSKGAIKLRNLLRGKIERV